MTMKMPKTGMAVPHHGAGQSSNLMDVAYTRLERMIVNGNLQPGQWVSETY